MIADLLMGINKTLPFIAKEEDSVSSEGMCDNTLAISSDFNTANTNLIRDEEFLCFLEVLEHIEFHLLLRSMISEHLELFYCLTNHSFSTHDDFFSLRNTTFAFAFLYGLVFLE